MKNLILNFVLIFSFFLGSTVVSASLLKDGGVDVISIIYKNEQMVSSLIIPSQFFNSNGILTVPYRVEVLDYATKQVVFSKETKDVLLDLSGLSLKQSRYVVTLKIGDYVDSCIVKA